MMAVPGAWLSPDGWTSSSKKGKADAFLMFVKKTEAEAARDATEGWASKRIYERQVTADRQSAVVYVLILRATS